MKQNNVIGVVVAVVVLLLAAGGFYFYKNHQTSVAMTNYTGKLVSVDYIGAYTGGEVFDTSIEDVAKKNGLYATGRSYMPIQFTVGSGNMIPGFERAINGMKIGETKRVYIEPKDGYGEYSGSKIITISRSLFQQANIVPKVGDTYQMSGQPIKILEVGETEVKVDTNNPMAGKMLMFDITLKSVQ